METVFQPCPYCVVVLHCSTANCGWKDNAGLSSQKPAIQSWDMLGDWEHSRFPRSCRRVNKVFLHPELSGAHFDRGSQALKELAETTFLPTAKHWPPCSSYSVMWPSSMPLSSVTESLKWPPITLLSFCSLEKCHPCWTQPWGGLLWRFSVNAPAKEVWESSIIQAGVVAQSAYLAWWGPDYPWPYPGVLWKDAVGMTHDRVCVRAKLILINPAIENRFSWLSLQVRNSTMQPLFLHVQRTLQIKWCLCKGAWNREVSVQREAT